MRSYTVKSGDTLNRISVRYYGTPQRWTEIVKANPQLAGRKLVYDGSPTIYPGDVLIIPDDSLAQSFAQEPVKETVVLDENAPTDFSVIVNGKKFTGFTGCTLVRSVFGVDAFSFSSVWDSGRQDLRNAFRPFAYAPCEVYFSNELIFKGRILTPAPAVQPDAQTLNVQGYPLCGVLLDSTLPPSLMPAEQRGMYLTNLPDGNLLIYKPETEAVSMTFAQGEVPFVSCAPTFDAQSMYSHITGYTKTTNKAPSAKWTYENKLLIDKGVLRCYADVIDDAVEGTLEDSVKAMAGRMFGKCVKYKLTVSGYRDKDGKLYRENMAVSVKAPGAEIYKDTKLLVDEVTLRRDDSSGMTAEFSLVLPGSRDGNLPEDFPWEE